VTRRPASAIGLPLLEDITDASGVAPLIETLLPAGARHRQLHARTLLIGMQLALSGRRPAHLTEVHAALTSLPAADQQRLGVTEHWNDGPHQLTYRQIEHTHRLINRALARTSPDGTPSPALQHACDALTEASIPEALKNASTSMAADWTDVEAWARPVPHQDAGSGTDPEAGWGHRNVGRAIEEARCSSATSCRPRSWWPTTTARPSPSSPAASPPPAPATTPPPRWQQSW